MTRVIYTRRAAKRVPRFAVQTQILEAPDGSRVVQKRAEQPEAQEHLERIAQAYDMLQQQYADTELSVNACRQTGAGLELEYLEGTTFETELDRLLLKEGAEAVADALQQYLADLIPDGKLKKDGHVTDDFREFFGSAEGLSEPFSTLPVTDIDAIPANVLLTEQGRVLLDYEWTFIFPIPVAFVRYRVLHYYRESSVMRKKLLPETIYAQVGLTEQERTCFAAMEAHFQAMRGAEQTTDADIREESEAFGNWAGLDILRIYLSANEEFSEEQVSYVLFEEGEAKISLPVPDDMRFLRMDPGEQPAKCVVRELHITSSLEESAVDYPGIRKKKYAFGTQASDHVNTRLAYTSNGTQLDTQTIVFPVGDPQIFVTLPEGKNRHVQLALTLSHPTKQDLQKEHRQAQQKPGLWQRLRRSIVQKRLGPMPLYHIDSQSASSEFLVIRGWAYDPEEEVSITLQTTEGEPIAADLRRIRRADVETKFRIPDPQENGFYLCARRADCPSEVKLVFATEKHRQTQICQTDVNLAPESDGIDKTAGRDYHEWFLTHRVTEDQLEIQRQSDCPYQPKISIVVPLYHTELPYLRTLLESVLAQSYPNWELCLADGSSDDVIEKELAKPRWQDARICYRHLSENRGISGNTNAAITEASGDFVAFADHDDMLEADALFAVVEYLTAHPETDLLYTDEDLTDETGAYFYSPRFKPDFSPELLRCINYICHLLVVHRNLLDCIGHLQEEMDGAQDWDLILRCAEQAECIGHIPRVLYHWRAYGASTAGNPDSKTYAIRAGERAVQASLKRQGLSGKLEDTGIFVMFRPLLDLEERPLVSILIPNADQAQTLRNCVNSILQKSTYDRFEILILENNSQKEETFACYRELEAQDARIRICAYKGPFNYSSVNNLGAEQACGSYLMLLNNDTEVITPDWLERMLGYAQLDEVGIVGAKLLYPDKTVQHAGVVIGLGGFAGHIFSRAEQTDAGRSGRLQAILDVSAVTGACLLVKKEIYDAVGGLDPELQVALNDVDFCLRVRARGQRIVQHNGVELFHYESKSRGYEETPEKRRRFLQEVQYFRDRWQQVLADGDPYYNPNLSLVYGDERMREDEERFPILEEMEKDGR